MQDQYDIVIVGAGLVGASLACALNEYDLRIAIIDAKPLTLAAPQNNAFATRALALNYASVQTFIRLNVWTHIAPIAQPIKTVHVSDQKHFGSVRIRAEQMQVEALGYVVPADQLLTVLQQQLSALNITVIAPANVKTLEQVDTGFRIQFEYEQKLSTLSTQLLIGADGNHSHVRTLLGINTATHDYQESAILATVQLSQSHKNIAYERFTSVGPIAMLPLAEKCMKMVWVVPNSQLKDKMTLDEGAFLAQLQQQFGFRLGRFKKCSTRTAYPLTSTIAELQALEGAILLGNAAHSFHPVGAQGFNLSLRDVMTLVDIVTQRLSHGQSLNAAQLVRQYLTQSKPYQQRILKATQQLTQYFSSDFLPVKLGRNVAMNALTLMPIFKRRLAKTFMGI